MVLPFLLLCLPIALCAGVEMEFPGCPGRDRCSHMFVDAAVDFRRRNCECDSDCVDFGDCCEDYPRDDAKRRERYSDRMRCVGFGSSPANLGAYMVVDCLAGAEPDLRAKCKAHYEPVIVFPDGPTYLNEQCAACNGHALDSLIRWDLIVDCEGPALSSAYIRQNLKQAVDGGWIVEFGSKTYVCDVRFNFSTTARRSLHQPIDVRSEVFKLNDLFNNLDIALRDPKLKLSDLFARRALRPLRLCRASLVSECPREWSDERVREECSGGYAATVYGLRRAYRNPHCALCNGEDLRILVCDPSELDMGRRKEFTFAHLFDVRGGKNSICAENQTYDYHYKICRRLVCAIPGRVIVDGKCIKKPALMEEKFYIPPFFW